MYNPVTEGGDDLRLRLYTVPQVIRLPSVVLRIVELVLMGTPVRLIR